MATCPSCHRDLTEDSESGQCPHCGHAWGVLKLGGVGVLDVVKAEVGFGAEKSWIEQWGQVERSYKKVQDLYMTTVDNQDALTVVKDFFVHTWHLQDWLKRDPATNVGYEDIGALLRSEFDMKVCNAMANTTKHYDLDEKMTARVSSVVTQPKGQVAIEISETDGARQTRDALELATSCMGIWQKFLASHGLKT